MSNVSTVEQWITARDPEAFHALVLEYSNMVYATCRRVLRDAMEAEDAAQESFQALAMLRKAPKGDLGPWLHRVALYRALNRLRERTRRERRERQYANAAGAAAVEWDDLYEFVDEAIAELPERYRQPIVMRFLQCMTQEAVGARLGVTRQTADYRIQRGLEGLRKSLKRKGIVTLEAALGIMLAAHAAEAAPASLMERLGRLALVAQAAPILPGTSLMSRIGAAFSLKTAGTAVAVVATAAIIFLYAAGGADLPARKAGQHARAVMPRKPAPKRDIVRVAPVIESVAASAASPSKPASLAGLKPGAIMGGVLGLEGEPRSGVEVVLQQYGVPNPLRMTAISDPHGRYAFSEVPFSADEVPAETRFFHLTAETDGLYAETLCVMRFCDWRQFHELALSPASFVDCTVVDDRGRPVESGSIHLDDVGGGFMQKRFPKPGVLGAGGTCRLGPLFPSVYEMKLQADGYPVFRQTIPYDMGRLQVVLKQADAVAGTVVTATGETVPGVRIEAREPSGQREIASATSRADGTFALALQNHASLLLTAYDEERELQGGPVVIDGEASRKAPPTLVLGPAGTVSGRVVDSVTQEGVMNVRVIFVKGRQPQRRAMTDASGAYVLKGLSGAGKVVALNFFSTEYERAVDMAGGETLEHVDFTLDRRYRISGRVRDAEGQPVAGAFVALAAEGECDPPERARRLALTSEGPAALTDEAGRFLFFSPAAAKGLLIQAVGGHGASQRVGPLDLAETGLEGLVLQTEPASVIAGRVLDGRGQYASNVTVVLQPLDPARSSISLAEGFFPQSTEVQNLYPGAGGQWSQRGIFEFINLLSGTYRLMAFLDSSSIAEPLACLDVTVRGGETLCDVSLRITTDHLGSVAGHVTSQGRPQPNLKLELIQPTQNMVTVTGPDGAYRFDNVSSEGGMIVVQDPHRDSSLAGKHCAIIAGKQTTLDFDLPAGQGKVEGTVRVNSAAGDGYRVWLAPIEPEGGATLRAVCNGSGDYEIGGVPEGVFGLLVGPASGQDKPLQQTLVIISGGNAVQHDFDVGNGTVEVSVAGIGEQERVHLAVLRGEVDIAELSEDALVALLPQAINYERLKDGETTMTFAGLSPGTYTIVAAAEPRDKAVPEHPLERMRAVYSLITVADEVPQTVVLNLAP